MEIELIARGLCVQEDKILLAYLKEKDYYFLPGGHVEYGESVLTALEREIQEEISLDATAEAVVQIFEHTWKNIKTNLTVHEMNFLITFAVPKEAALIAQVPHLEFVWLPVSELSNIRFLPSELLPYVKEVIGGNPVAHFVSSMRK